MNSLGLQYSTSEDEEEVVDAVNESQAPPQPNCSSPETITLPTTLNIDNLPPSPRGDANPEVQARIARYLDIQRQTNNDKPVKSFQVNLQTKKEVANPYILKNVVDYFGIDQLETNFAPDVFDPYGLPLHEYTDKIAVAQENASRERIQRHSTRDSIAFTNAKAPNAF